MLFLNVLLFHFQIVTTSESNLDSSSNDSEANEDVISSLVEDINDDAKFIITNIEEQESLVKQL